MSEQPKLLDPAGIIDKIAREFAMKVGYKTWGYYKKDPHRPSASETLVQEPVITEIDGAYHAIFAHEDRPDHGVTRLTVRDIGGMYAVSVANHYGIVNAFGDGCTCFMDRAVADTKRRQSKE